MMMKNGMNRAAAVVVATGLMACGQPEDSQVDIEFADSSFALTSANDCVRAFSDQPFLRQLASKNSWGAEEIGAFCDEVESIAAVYANNATMTVLTVAGAAVRSGQDLGAAYYLGVAGYDLTAIRTWLRKVQGAQAVRQCAFRAFKLRFRGQTLPPGFVGSCLEDVTGEPYPDPIFQKNLSSVGIEDIGSQGGGLAASLAVYDDPRHGTVVAFLGGLLYTQSQPAYAGFVGCGAALGFDLDPHTEGGALSPLCLGNELGSTAP